MKKIKVLGLILSAVALTAFFMACSNPAGSDDGRRGQGDIRFTVTFNTNGGNDAPPCQSGLARGARVIEPADPVKEPAGWFNFMGWYSDINLTNRWDFATGVTANMTLFARWEAIGNIGDPGPGGHGIIFYRRDEGFIMADTGERAFFLVVAPAASRYLTSWANPPPGFPSLPPRPGLTASTHRLIPGLGWAEDQSCWAVGRGRLNTALIVHYGASGVLDGDPPFPTPAATYAYNYSGGGFTDWFLPSKDELARLRQAGAIINLDPILNYWWTSSQNNTHVAHAWAFDFRDERIVESAKTNASQQVRPIRAF